MDKKLYLLIGLLLIFAVIIGLLFGYYFFGGKTEQNMMGNMMGRGMMGEMMRNMEEINRKTKFSSNGERIFYTGINTKGEAIKNSHGMQGVGCAMCHGADAKGMQMMMEMPSLRWDLLTDPRGHNHPNGRKHPPFTELSFKVCILAGIDPAGNQLSTMMPRWQMSNEDLDDLINYLKDLTK